MTVWIRTAATITVGSRVITRAFVLGGLAELSRITGHSELLQQAETIGDAAILRFSDKNGIIHESCEPVCSGDGNQLKSIFILNLAQLDQRSSSPRYAGVMRVNTVSIIENAQGPNHSLGLVWSGPPGRTTSISRTAASDAFNAAIFSSRSNLPRTATHVHLRMYLEFSRTAPMPDQATTLC